jgi:choline-sulfatase
MRRIPLQARALCLAAGLAWCAAAGGAESPPNLLLITLDTFRGDRLGANTATGVATPHLDRLAAAGANFSHARAPVPLTLPSHASILTATWPWVHGVRDNGEILTGGRPTLAGVLHGAGYATAAFVGSFVLDHRFGLARGFDTYDDRVATSPASLENVEAERDGAAVVDAFAAWLAERDPERPFFAWVHLYDPHAPHVAPASFADRYPHDPYAAEIAYTDSLVGRATALLDRAGLAARTVVAVAGDHGEGLGEHGESTHALLIYNSTLHVPMLLYAPGLVPATTVDDVVRTIDLAPTLLDYLGVAERLGDGESLRRRVEGGPRLALAALSESLYSRRHLGWNALHGIERGGWRYIAAPAPELYDVASDPRETVDRAGERPEVAQRLAGELAAAIDLDAAAPAPSVDVATAARLRSLGYLTTATPPSPAPIDPKERIAVWEGLQRAVDLYGRGEFAAAAVDFAAVLRSERQMPLAYEYLGAAYMRLERRDEAERVYEEALRRGIESPAIRLDLGLIQRGRGAAERAEAEWLRALELDPAQVTALFDLGELYRASGRREEAEARFRAAVAINPDYVYAWNGLGRVLAEARPEDALAAFERAVELAPNEPRGELNLAVQLERMGRRDAARQAYARCLDLVAGGGPAEVSRAAAAGLRRLGG